MVVVVVLVGVVVVGAAVVVLVELVVVVGAVVVVIGEPNGQTPSAGGFIALKRVASFFVITSRVRRARRNGARPEGLALAAHALIEQEGLRGRRPAVREDRQDRAAGAARARRIADQVSSLRFSLALPSPVVLLASPGFALTENDFPRIV